MTITVGSYEAKTQLPKLLVAVERGETVTITRHGTPIARVVPIKDHALTPSEAVDRLLALSEQVALGPDLTSRELIEDGRR